eukprot:1549972-Rhodomonas_salina.1
MSESESGSRFSAVMVCSCKEKRRRRSRAEKKRQGGGRSLGEERREERRSLSSQVSTRVHLSDQTTPELSLRPATAEGAPQTRQENLKPAK